MGEPAGFLAGELSQANACIQQPLGFSFPLGLDPGIGEARGEKRGAGTVVPFGAAVAALGSRRGLGRSV